MHLVELGRGVFAWTHPNPRFGDSNVGLVIDGDGLTVIDTTATPERGVAVRRAIEELTEELALPLRRVVVTSSRVAFSGGGAAFWQAGFYATEATSDQLDAPASPDALRRLLPHLAGAYHGEFATRPITHTVTERAWLTPAAEAIPLPGESPANLVVHVAGADVVFAGALASFGVTPLAFDGDPEAWIGSLAAMRDLAATIVPGHGPPGGAADVEDLVGYLGACIDAAGDPGAIRPGPWDRWPDRRFDPVNVERAERMAAGDGAIPRSLFDLLGL